MGHFLAFEVQNVIVLEEEAGIAQERQDVCWKCHWLENLELISVLPLSLLRVALRTLTEKNDEEP